MVSHQSRRLPQRKTQRRLLRVNGKASRCSPAVSTTVVHDHSQFCGRLECFVDHILIGRGWVCCVCRSPNAVGSHNAMAVCRPTSRPGMKSLAITALVQPAPLAAAGLDDEGDSRLLQSPFRRVLKDCHHKLSLIYMRCLMTTLSVRMCGPPSTIKDGGRMGSHSDDGSEAQCNPIKRLHYGCMEIRQDDMGFSKRHPKASIPTLLDAPSYPGG